MKEKLVIVPNDDTKTYTKTILPYTADYEISFYANNHGLFGNIDDLVKAGYIIMTTNGAYHKIYLSNRCSRMQMIELSEFLSSNRSFGFMFAKVTIYSYDDNKVNKKVIDGNMSIVELETFIGQNISITDEVPYRVSSNINYKDDEIIKNNNISK